MSITTLDGAVTALVSAWSTLGGYARPDLPVDLFPTQVETFSHYREGGQLRENGDGFTSPEKLHPHMDRRLEVASIRELQAMAAGFRHTTTAADDGATQQLGDPPVMDSDLADTYAGLQAFLAIQLWRTHPVATAMKDSPFGRHHTTAASLVDLDALPADPAIRAAALTTSAWTARQEVRRLGSMIPGLKASDARRGRELVDLHTTYLDAALGVLPGAFGPWVDIPPAPRPAVAASPLHPTVQATAWVELGAS